MNDFQLNKNEKYAMIVIPQTYIHFNFPESIQLKNDLWVTRILPFPIEEHWKQWLGELKIKEIEEANLFLITKSYSKTAPVVDHENKKLKDLISTFYWSISLSGFFRCDHKPFQLTGSFEKNSIGVDEITYLENPERIKESPIEKITKPRLKIASEIADAFQMLSNIKNFRRINRIFHAFFNGLLNKDIGERLHQFVRCIEGFINPKEGKTKKQFKYRTELFVGRGYHDYMEELFNLRSSIEHLHSPIRAIKGADKKTRWETATKRTIEAEALARYCIKSFLLNSNIWEHFEDDSAIEKFWKLPFHQRQKLWGHPFDLKEFSNQMKI